MLDVMLTSWACEVTDILAQRSSEEATFVRTRVTSQAQIASVHVCQINTELFLLYTTLLKILFHSCPYLMLYPSF